MYKTIRIIFLEDENPYIIVIKVGNKYLFWVLLCLPLSLSYYSTTGEMLYEFVIEILAF